VALEIEIDGELCMGSGNCVYWAPQTFDIGDDGIAVVIDAAASPEDDVLHAAKNCPTHAITVRRDGT
jgi:ferredoxin